MRYKAILSLLTFAISSVAQAHWEKINDVDYTWGPFKIYNISLFTETGEYKKSTRPVMLTLKYSKPVDGRDFAISIAKSWADLGVNLQNQDDTIDKLRKTLPDLKPDDVLSYIALENRGYFVLNNTVIDQEFDQAFNDAMLAVWLDPKMKISQQLTSKKAEGTAQEVHYSEDYTPHKVEKPAENGVNANAEIRDMPASTVLAVDSEPVAQNAGDIATQQRQQNETKAQSINIAEKNTELKTSNEAEKQAANPVSETPLETEKNTSLPAVENKTTEPEKAPAPKENKEEMENPEKIILPEYDPISSDILSC